MQRVGATEWIRTTSHDGAVRRAVAISRDTVGGTNVYASIVTTPPGGTTRRHHHGDCDTAIYVLEGQARFTSGPTGVEDGFDASAGDFVHIPAGEVHVEENASATEPLVVVISRNCPGSVVHYLDEE